MEQVRGSKGLGGRGAKGGRRQQSALSLLQSVGGIQPQPHMVSQAGAVACATRGAGQPVLHLPWRCSAGDASTPCVSHPQDSQPRACRGASMPRVCDRTYIVRTHTNTHTHAHTHTTLPCCLPRSAGLFLPPEVQLCRQPGRLQAPPPPHPPRPPPPPERPPAATAWRLGTGWHGWGSSAVWQAAAGTCGGAASGSCAAQAAGACGARGTAPGVDCVC